MKGWGGWGDVATPSTYGLFVWKGPFARRNRLEFANRWIGEVGINLSSGPIGRIRPKKGPKRVFMVKSSSRTVGLYGNRRFAKQALNPATNTSRVYR